MNLLNIEILGDNAQLFEIQTPSKWEELQPFQVEAAAAFRLNHDSEGRQKMLLELLNLDKKRLKVFMEILIDDAQSISTDVPKNETDVPELGISVLDLYPLMDFITEEVVWGKDLYPAPNGFISIGDRFKNIEVAQFFLIEYLYQTYRESRNEENLNMLIAAIYPYNHFDKDKIEKDAKKYSLLDIPVKKKANETALRKAKKQALLLNFIGQRASFVQDYKILFPTPSKEELSKEQEPINYLNEFRTMVYTLPNEKFGTIDKIEKTKITKVFLYLEQMKIDSQKSLENEL
jgi:hypothetical protein